jgi:hypothetical protein
MHEATDRHRESFLSDSRSAWGPKKGMTISQGLATRMTHTVAPQVPGKLTMGQQKYYVDQVAQGIEEYYADAGEAPGRWLASSQQLGLDGDVDATHLRAVLQAHDPTDTNKLVTPSSTRNRPVEPRVERCHTPAPSLITARIRATTP